MQQQTPLRDYATEFLPYQIEGADFLAMRIAALLGDEMRLGKSAQSIKACDLVRARKILILCPASVKINWKREFLKWSKYKRTFQILYGRDAHIDRDIDVTIVNYELTLEFDLWFDLWSMDYDVLIVDECHYLKGIESARTKAVLLKGALASKARQKWFLSGTPMPNRPLELFPILKACASHVLEPYSTLKTYGRHFCGSYQDVATGKWIMRGATNKAELNKRLKGFMLRRLRKDHLDELPINYQVVPIPAEGKYVTKLIEQEFNWSREDASYQDLGELEDHISIIRRELAMYKVKYVVQHVKLMMSLENKLVLFAFHREVIKELQKELKSFHPVVIMGGVSSKVRDERIDKFQNDEKYQILIGQITAAGVGREYTASNNILFAESGWVSGDIDQAASRCSGHNQLLPVSAQFMMIEDSLEEHMMRVVIEKNRNIEDILN